MSATKLKATIEEQRKIIEELKAKNENLNISLENEKKEKENVVQAKELEWQEKDRIKTEEYEAKLDELDLKIENTETELKDTKIQLDRKELKKLAQAFSEQEDIHKNDQERWFKYLIWVSIALILYAIVSICLTAGKLWFERIGYYVIDIILVSGVWFCSSQFSEATRLRYDYGNRKTLAQSFHNILNNLAEDEDIRSKFIEKATDVLCAPAGASSREPILTKKVLKDVAEIVGAAIKH